LRDVNGDAKADLVVANNGSNDVSVLLGDGAGSFAGGRLFAVGVGPVSVVIGDWNGDKRPDLAATLSGSGTIGILFNQSQ
jgi:hypothetical protein